jgi:hypothetical protein
MWFNRHLTVNGDLFCGDLLANVIKPAIWFLIDDSVIAQTSIEKLKRLQINSVPWSRATIHYETFHENTLNN